LHKELHIAKPKPRNPRKIFFALGENCDNIKMCNQDSDGKMAIGLEERKYILNKETERIVEILIREYSPEKIILFGSLATGNLHEWSDIDLVIIKKTDKRFIDRLHEVRLMTSPVEGVDFIVYTPEEIDRMQEEKRRFLIKEILAKGEVIYEKR
jgi:predicted nucleotidyltransferase